MQYFTAVESIVTRVHPCAFMTLPLFGIGCRSALTQAHRGDAGFQTEAVAMSAAGMECVIPAVTAHFSAASPHIEVRLEHVLH